MLFAYLHTCPGFVSSLAYGSCSPQLLPVVDISMPRESTKGEVINVRSDLAIMVSVKPNTWLTIEELTLSTIQRFKSSWLAGWLVGWLVGCGMKRGEGL